jgi:hypothetical protein
MSSRQLFNTSWKSKETNLTHKVFILKRKNEKYGLSPEVEFEDKETLIKKVEDFVKHKRVEVVKL